MDEVFKLGPMGQNILENGEKIKYMVQGNFGILMEIFLKVILQMNKQTDMEFLYIKKEVDMKGFGKMMCRMGKEKNTF